MAWLNYNTIQDDLVSLLSAGVSSAKVVKKEADERDYSFASMPLIDVRLKSSNPEIRAGRDYYVFVTFEVQISVFDLSSFADAAEVRHSVLSSAIDTVRNSANFSSVIETSRIGQIEFQGVKDEKSGAFMSGVTFEVITESFVDRS